MNRATIIIVCSAGGALIGCSAAKSDWTEAKATDTLSGYETFVQNHPKDPHVDDARFQLTALDRATAWKSAQGDPSVATLEQFLQKYPEGAESNEARQMLASVAYRVQMDQSRSKADAERKRAHLQARFGAIVHEVVVVPPAAADTHYQVSSGPKPSGC